MFLPSARNALALAVIASVGDGLIADILDDNFMLFCLLL
jgi:hypothetical protein